MDDIKTDARQVQQSSTMTVVMSADDRFVMPLAVTIHSIARHLDLGDRVTILLIDGGITEKNHGRLERWLNRIPQISLVWLKPDLNQLAGLKGMHHLSLATYFRLLIPSLVPDGTARVIFLDCDLIVRSNIKPLWLTDFDDSALLVVRDQLISVVGSENGLPETYQSMGLSAADPYFNGGVLVINVEQWKQLNIADAIIQFLRTNFAVVRFADQDGLNAVLSRRVKVLDPRWNYQYSAMPANATWADRRAKLQECFIVHYTGPNKPWTPGILDPERIEFLKYLRRSRWFSTFAFARLVASYVSIHFRHGFIPRVKSRARRLVKRAINKA